jgi:cyanophycinase
MVSPDQCPRQLLRQLILLSTGLLLAACAAVGTADDDRPSDRAPADTSANASATSADADSAADPLAGHSFHGEAFNEGPRQAAFLMSGTGPISFEVSSSHPQVRKFVEQGIGQLHGFWYFEAERSFRHAAMLDPDCAIAYWGMALANAENDERAKEFIAEAVQRRDKASERERAYIDAVHKFLTGENKKREREQQYVSALAKLVEKYPDDLEAKAFWGYALYKYRTTVKKSYNEVDSVLDEVIEKQPLHPVHHYRIHLWDYKNAQRALDSAAKCGLGSPSVAHMWHMCGHIFSRLKRYGDAAWFQEASARVDHRHMMHDQMLPDEIHNFAHNNEWLIRNLMNVGRVNDAVDLAKNMIELPRHPKYNTLSNRKSTSYGRERLFDVLVEYELWPELIAAATGTCLEPTDDPAEQLQRLRHLGTAYARAGQTDAASEIIAQIDALREKEPQSSEKLAAAGQGTDAGSKSSPAECQEKEENKREREQHERRERDLKRAAECVRGHIAWQKADFAEALRHLTEAAEDKLLLARLQALNGNFEAAIAEARRYRRDHRQEVLPLAALLEILWQSGNEPAAREVFVELRALSNWIQLGSPVFARLEPIAVACGFPADWRVERPEPDDLGERPQLDALGPFRWQPPPAADWLLPDRSGYLHSLQDYRGRGVVVIFYLGFGCLHCAEQLQAIAPRIDEFTKAGLSVIAISSDSLEGLARSQENYGKEPMPFPLVANPDHDVFRAYRAYDDFEDQPLHGTFVINAAGRICWQDISYEPFMDVDFLLRESQRLLPPPRKAAENRGPAVAVSGESAVIAESDSASRSGIAATRRSVASVGPANGDAGRETTRRTVEHGTLMMVGGGRISREITRRFVASAGGAKARIVVLPTAMPDPLPPQSSWAERLRRAGAGQVDLLTSRQRATIEGREYDAILAAATGIWFEGGRQWRYVDAYLGSRAQQRMREVLRRGGIIGGTSAGASIQADFLVRGNPSGNEQIMAAGYEQGLQFLPGAAVDQHFSQRDRFGDLRFLIAKRPDLLGIGIDESTAVVVNGSTAEVIGDGRVYLYDHRTAARPRVLSAGDVVQLSSVRETALGGRNGGPSLRSLGPLSRARNTAVVSGTMRSNSF